MPKRYWVVGGDYADADFIAIAGGGEPERHGPFDNYDEARGVWARRSWDHVDDAHVRYSIETEEASAYWVVGGAYAGTGFDEMARGGAEERYGPFQSYKEAQALWRQMSGKHAGDARMRYRIDHI